MRKPPTIRQILHATQDMVPRSRLNAVETELEAVEAKLAHVQEVAHAEILRLQTELTTCRDKYLEEAANISAGFASVATEPVGWQYGQRIAAEIRKMKSA